MDARLDHVGVNVRDLPAQTAWYRAAFGLRTVFGFTLEGPGLRGVVLEHPHQGWRIELLARPGSVPGPRAPDPLTAALTEGYGHFAVTTPELDPVHTAWWPAGRARSWPPGRPPNPEYAWPGSATPREISSNLAVAAAQMCITVPSSINGEITSAFGASASQVAWVTSAFILPTAILELNFGVVGDIFGRKRLLVWGGFILALGELINATAQSISMLWIGRPSPVSAPPRCSPRRSP